MTQVEVELAANVKLVRGWILDGAGPARYGYARIDPCKQTWLGRTLQEAAMVLGVDGEVRR